jgi:hypothetical protein
MRWWSRRRNPIGLDVIPGRTSEEPVVSEAAALVEGRAAQEMTDSEVIPRWAWLNALAHGTSEQLEGLVDPTRNPTGDVWADAVAAIAAMLIGAGTERTGHIQTALLVPWELEAMARSDWPVRPDLLIDAVEHCVHPNRGRTPGPPGRP